MWSFSRKNVKYEFYTGALKYWILSIFVITWLEWSSNLLPITDKSELTYCSPMSHFYTPWKPMVFWSFQGVEKCGIGLKCINLSGQTALLSAWWYYACKYIKLHCVCKLIFEFCNPLSYSVPIDVTLAQI